MASDDSLIWIDLKLSSRSYKIIKFSKVVRNVFFVQLSSTNFILFQYTPWNKHIIVYLDRYSQLIKGVGVSFSSILIQILLQKEPIKVIFVLFLRINLTELHLSIHVENVWIPMRCERCEARPRHFFHLIHCRHLIFFHLTSLFTSG